MQMTQNRYTFIQMCIKHIFPLFSMQILPQFIFNSRDPIVVGVMIEAGIVKEGTPICVPSQEVSNFIHKTNYKIKYFFFSV